MSENPRFPAKRSASHNGAAKRKKSGGRGFMSTRPRSRCSSSTPWLPANRFYSAGVVGLHQEIEDFYSWIAPRDYETRLREELVGRISRVICRVYPHAVVKPFGSFCTGLFLPNSDLDIVVFGKWVQLPMYSLQQELVAAGICSLQDVRILDKASVPILKFVDKKTGVKVDVSFNMISGVNSARFITDCISRHRCLPKLVFVLKQFLQSRDLNEVFTGGISSYSLILMAISFLQRHPRYFPSDREDNLGVLLIEFFELYARHFNYYDTAIRVNGGVGNGGLYVKKKMMEFADGKPAGVLCIEDPVQPGHDVGRSSYGVLDVKHAFEYAYLRLTQAVMENDSVGGSILSKIIRVPDEVVQQRDWTESKFAV